MDRRHPDRERDGNWVPLAHRNFNRDPHSHRTRNLETAWKTKNHNLRKQLETGMLVD